MPKLTFKPEGQEPQTWEFTFGRITLGEMKSVQHLTGMTWDQVKRGFRANDVTVIHALLYTFLKRDNPALRPTDLEFFEDDYALALTESEIREQIAALTDGEVRDALAVAEAIPSSDVTEPEDLLSIELLRERAAGSETSGPKATPLSTVSDESPTTSGTSPTSSTLPLTDLSA